MACWVGWGPASHLCQVLDPRTYGSALLGTLGQDSISLRALVFSSVKWEVMLLSWGLSLIGTSPGPAL